MTISTNAVAYVRAPSGSLDTPEAKAECHRLEEIAASVGIEIDVFCRSLAEAFMNIYAGEVLIVPDCDEGMLKRARLRGVHLLVCAPADPANLTQSAVADDRGS